MFKFMSNIFPSIRSSIKKNFDSLLWMGFNSLKATEPLRGDSLLYLPSLFITCPGLNNATKEISNNSKTHDFIMTFSKNN